LVGDNSIAICKVGSAVNVIVGKLQARSTIQPNNVG
jgi:hypothetical protein